MTSNNSRLPVFVSYAHEDNAGSDPNQRLLDRLLQMLKPLNLQDQVCAWSDRDIKPGQQWESAIAGQMEHYAEAAVLLISPAFLASNFIRDSELPILLKRAQDDGVLILPVILHECLFRETFFKYPDPKKGPKRLSLDVFQAVNDLSPLDSLPRHEQDKVLARVGRSLLEVHSTRPDERPARKRLKKR